MVTRARPAKPAPRAPAKATPRRGEPPRPPAKAKSEPSRPPAKAKSEPPRLPAKAKIAEPPRPPAKVTFPKKAQPPTDAEFGARLPAAVGKRFEALRALLKKYAAVEDFYYYGPRTGWAYRYLRGTQSLCSIVILQGRLVGIVALDAAAQAKVAWDALSDVTRRARKVAHGTPALLWLDIPLDGTGATDFKSLLRAKLGA
jgi:Protein of unknown function (DUF3788)